MSCIKIKQKENIGAKSRKNGYFDPFRFWFVKTGSGQTSQSLKNELDNSIHFVSGWIGEQAGFPTIFF